MHFITSSPFFSRPAAKNRFLWYNELKNSYATASLQKEKAN